MSEQHVPPTSEQRRLVNIGMFIQFHLAAIGHLVVWLWMLVIILRTPTPIHPSDEGYDAWFFASIFAGTGIPISFGVLVAVYILFRCLLAYTNFGTALIVMIAIDVLHAGIMGLAGIGIGFSLLFVVPLRLAIPIVLYSFALRSYMKDNASRERNEVERPDTTRSTG